MSHVDDDSNANTAFDRNRLRLEVWPALTRAFPGAEQAFCQAAQQAALADAFIRETTSQMLADMQDEAGLDAVAWAQLSAVQRHWVMRQWLMQQLDVGVPIQALRRITQEALGRRLGRWPLTPGRELRLYRGRFAVASVALRAADGMPPISPAAQAQALLWPASVRAGFLPLPSWGGVLEWQVADQGGVLPRTLAGAVLRERGGGEQFQLGPGRPARALKKQFQSLGVPMWARSGPLVWQGERLVFVPGLGVDARCQAAPGEPQLMLRWHPDSTTAVSGI
ncbi:MAG: hypothetical protein C4K60_18265 [Ideonella sp. MAG2]|nr:MAG: hypothetical protein C4K60_18265 [Ideonella sp. MAG2]